MTINLAVFDKVCQKLGWAVCPEIIWKSSDIAGQKPHRVRGAFAQGADPDGLWLDAIERRVFNVDDFIAWLNWVGQNWWLCVLQPFNSR